MLDLIITLMMRLAKEVPDILDALASEDADAETRLRMWLENQAELKAEAERTTRLVEEARARRDQDI